MKNCEQRKPVPDESQPLRLFFALWPDGGMQSRLHHLGSRHQALCGGRLMRAETLHMTLLFLGETAKSCLPQVLQAAAEIHVPAFKMELSHFSCWQHNAIGYVAPENCPAELNELARQLRASVAGAGIGFDRKAFNPHVTLLRKMPQWRPSQPVAPLDWEVRDFALVQSVPESCGAHYAILARWPLGSIRA